MTEGEVSFDKDRCTKECLDVLTAYNMDHEGHPLIGALHYEKMEYDFRQGEVLHNLNGSDYSVLMVLNQNDLFLMALKKRTVSNRRGYKGICKISERRNLLRGLYCKRN